MNEIRENGGRARSGSGWGAPQVDHSVRSGPVMSATRVVGAHNAPVHPFNDQPQPQAGVGILEAIGNSVRKAFGRKRA